MAAPIAGVAAAFDEATLLELIEPADELPPVVPESIGDGTLRLPRTFVEDGKHSVVVGMQPRSLVRLHRLILGGEAEPLQQECRRSDELLREAGKLRRPSR